MNKNKIIGVLIAILVVLIVVSYFGYKAQEKKYDDLLIGKDKKLEKIERKNRDNYNRLLDSTIENYTLKFEELEKQKNEIKYIRYEKYIYSDRTLDSAIIILSGAEY